MRRKRTRNYSHWLILLAAAVTAVAFLQCSSKANAQDEPFDHSWTPAVVPLDVPDDTVLGAFRHACMMMGRVRKQEDNLLVCNTTPMGARYPEIIHMRFERRSDGIAILTFNEVLFGGIPATSRTHNNYPLDLVLARQVLERHAGVGGLSSSSLSAN